MLNNKYFISLVCLLTFAALAGSVQAVGHLPAERQMRESRNIVDIICDRLDGRFFMPLSFCGEPQPVPMCGDGELNQAAEECDGLAGVGEHQACTAQCQLVDLPFCGDGLVNQAAEQCDGSSGVGEHQSCSAQCQLINLPFCGDGLVNQESEQCDGEAGVGENQTCNNQCLLEDLPPENLADHVVVNEVLYDLVSSGTQGSETSGLNEWVELFNPTDSAVDVTDWMLGSGASFDSLPTSSVPAMGFLLITNATSTFDFWSVPATTPIIHLLSSITASGLSNTGDAVVLKNASALEVDAMSYEADVSAFDPAAPEAADGESLSRSPNGVDTDTAADWEVLAVPTPGE